MPLRALGPLGPFGGRALLMPSVGLPLFRPSSKRQALHTSWLLM